MSARYFQTDDPFPPARGLYIDPATRRAAIVLWPDIEPRRVGAALAKLERSRKRSPSAPG